MRIVVAVRREPPGHSERSDAGVAVRAIYDKVGGRGLVNALPEGSRPFRYYSHRVAMENPPRPKGRPAPKGRVKERRLVTLDRPIFAFHSVKVAQLSRSKRQLIRQISCLRYRAGSTTLR
jgi:hypothetical protein